MTEVFRTNVDCKDAAMQLLNLLWKSFPHGMINFDLEDCDKILRVEAISFNPNEIIHLLKKEGYQCEILE